MSAPTITATAGAALQLAALGWPVQPGHHVGPNRECSCQASSRCESVGKHPRSGDDGKAVPPTTDAETIRGYWTRWPNASLRIESGSRSKLLMLDIDPRNGGDEHLAELVAAYGPLPQTAMCRTGGGGVHLYYHLANGAGNADLGRGVEVFFGKTFVAPPSRHRSGDTYQWAEGLAPWECSLAEAPEWLVALAPARPAGEKRTATAPDEIIPQGERFPTLRSLAGAMRARGATRESVYAALSEENRRCDPPLEESKIAYLAGMTADWEPGTIEPHLTDKGNSERLVRLHGADLLYSFELAKWFVWNGKRWEPDDTGEVERRAKETVDYLYAQAIGLEDPKLRDKFVQHGLKSEDVRRLNAMATLARSALPVRVAELDAYPGILNVENGIVDLRTGELLPHDRSMKLTRMAPTEYFPDAESDLWQGFLAKFIEEPAFLRRAVGYSIIGSCEEETAFFAHGPTLSGKSTFLMALYAALGEVAHGGYGGITPFSAFLYGAKANGPRDDLARLRGARVSISVEVGDGQRFDNALIKSLTGRDSLTVRSLHKNFFTYTPMFTIWLGANTRPTLDASDAALRRRIAVVPFPRGLRPEEVDPTIKERLLHDPGERAAFLSWAVRGALDYARGRLGVPERIAQETTAYFAEHDTVGGFINAQLEFGPDKVVTARALRSAYKEYCEGEGKPQESSQKMGDRLRTHGALREADRWHTWHGVALKRGGE